MPIVLIGTLDTKGRELGFVRDLIRERGREPLVIDAGAIGSPQIVPDIDRAEVFRRAGTTWPEVRDRGDRGRAVAQAAEGVAAIVKDLAARGAVTGIFALGGSAGTTIGTAAMRAVPFGIPKVMVSTLASGQTRPYVGGSDIMMMHSVADLAGLNRLTRTVLSNAAHALLGMVNLGPSVPAPRDAEAGGDASPRPVVAATMFGVTTPCVDRARSVLEEAGCEVLVFHATGAGGQALEGLVRDGQAAGVLDLTTTELADELVGGILTAGPDRLEAAGRKGLPQVVSLGALDMVNFGPRETVPDRFASRTFQIHNPNVTLMRTTPAENTALGRHMAAVLARATGPTVVLIPEGGLSALDAPGQPFFDPAADHALFEVLTAGLANHPQVRLVRRPEHINDPAFAETAARILLDLMNILQ
jgi:uncharacterized protein (UPF0261 family)